MRCLPCRLTDDEWQALAGELARVSEEEREKERAIERQKKEHAAEIKDMQEEVTSLRNRRADVSKAVRTREIPRDVVCDWFYALGDVAPGETEPGAAYLVRQDTGECVVSRAMSPKERQLHIGEQLSEADHRQVELWRQQLEEAAARAAEESEEEPSDEEEDSGAEE